MIHLICGPIGAGKTRYAQLLAAKHHAVLFSEDAWLQTLFVTDAPSDLLEQPIERIMHWASLRYQRCRNQIWSVAKELLIAGVPVVLDGGAANKDQRDSIRYKASKLNVAFQLHYICCDRNIRYQRVMQRNREHGDTYSLHVTPHMFEFTEIYFTPPAGDEVYNLIKVDTSRGNVATD